MLNRRLLWQKIAILWALGVVVLAVPLALFLGTTGRGIAAAELEARGTIPSEPIRRVVQLTQQHRGMAAGALRTTFRSGRKDRRSRWKSTGHRGGGCPLKREISNTDLLAAWDRAALAWQDLSGRVAAASVSSKESTGA